MSVPAGVSAHDLVAAEMSGSVAVFHVYYNERILDRRLVDAFEQIPEHLVDVVLLDEVIFEFGQACE